MSSLDTEFHRRLDKIVGDVEASRVRAMRSGALDFDRYKYESGYLKALEDVRVWCSGIEQDINEGK